MQFNLQECLPHIKFNLWFFFFLLEERSQENKVVLLNFKLLMDSFGILTSELFVTSVSGIKAC